MDITIIKAKTLPEAHFLCLKEILEKGKEYTIERGSYAGMRRKELNYVVINIEYPSTRPLLPESSPFIDVPLPADEDYLYKYLSYLITSEKQENEEYTYGEYLEKQIEEVIRMYKEDGFETNQACMTVGNPDCIYMDDPPCLRLIDTRIRNRKLHFFVYFRSWAAWNGLPLNLSAIQLLKEYMASEIGVEDGELVATSKGLHLYEFEWGFAKARVSISRR